MQEHQARQLEMIDRRQTGARRRNKKGAHSAREVGGALASHGNTSCANSMQNICHIRLVSSRSTHQPGAETHAPKRPDVTTKKPPSPAAMSSRLRGIRYHQGR